MSRGTKLPHLIMTSIIRIMRISWVQNVTIYWTNTSHLRQYGGLFWSGVIKTFIPFHIPSIIRLCFLFLRLNITSLAALHLPTIDTANPFTIKLTNIIVYPINPNPNRNHPIPKQLYYYLPSSDLHPHPPYPHFLLLISSSAPIHYSHLITYHHLNHHHHNDLD